MPQLPDHIAPPLTVALAISLFVFAGLVGGPDFGPDIGGIYRLAMERTEHPRLTTTAIMLTQIGGVQGLLAILLLAGAFLADARKWRHLIAMTAIVIGGRVMIEVLKLAIDRPRPAFGPHPVEVHSLSFPSGHAGNSMITFLAIAFIAAPARWRGRAVAIALVASIAIGATRPLLGVHWPSDVIGGWALGIGWVVGLSALSRSWRGAAE